MNDDLAPDLLAARSALDELLDSAPAALTPPAVWADGPYVAVAHEHAFTREPDGTAHLEKRRYLLTRVAEHRYPELLAQLGRAWRERGWVVESEDDPVLPVLRAKSPYGTAEFRIGFAGNGTLLARVDGLSAPVASYPFGGASTVPIGTDGLMDTVPRRQDPFWSV
ncbi:hypothetical protein HUT16_09765 [Kitasatospora sp. NA04385]|uniref:hypothetical protein n=1 Tax=Kitasatospora sp. NA04385 TaxID=2742135 RepID=UPI00159202A2|nr:hypothetical protein [Kitasatospora sp. NA04385]QKW19316.1 hypothetical protein HUT16_09765 [Kitasatospora sp. NA04385]